MISFEIFSYSWTCSKVQQISEKSHKFTGTENVRGYNSCWETLIILGGWKADRRMIIDLKKLPPKHLWIGVLAGIEPSHLLRALERLWTWFFLGTLKAEMKYVTEIRKSDWSSIHWAGRPSPWTQKTIHPPQYIETKVSGKMERKYLIPENPRYVREQSWKQKNK